MARLQEGNEGVKQRVMPENTLLTSANQSCSSNARISLARMPARRRRVRDRSSQASATQATAGHAAALPARKGPYVFQRLAMVSVRPGGFRKPSRETRKRTHLDVTGV
jgi:hypothetical protein